MLTAVGMAALVWLPQLCYWKYATGEWLFYSYAGERFFFDRPHLWQVLFSFRKGWLVYTPIMVFAIWGITQLPRYAPAWRFAIPVWLAAHLYVMSCWWIWWYGGSFGQRPMVETYAILSIPMAAGISRIMEFPQKIQWTTWTVLAALIALNLFQTVQMRLGVLHWDSMTATAYQKTFLKLHEPSDIEQYLDHPDLGKAILGNDE